MLMTSLAWATQCGRIYIVRLKRRVQAARGSSVLEQAAQVLETEARLRGLKHTAAVSPAQQATLLRALAGDKKKWSGSQQAKASTSR